MNITISPKNRGKIINPHHNNYNTELREPRLGIMLHYDESSSDPNGIAWFKHQTCEVSYNFYILDDGSYHTIAPLNSRAWHAGSCRPSSSKLPYKDANSAFVGIAAATNSQTPVTQRQILTIAGLCNQIYTMNNWNLNETFRLTGHADEAWQRGRRRDPYGYDRAHPVLNPLHIRELLPFVRIG